MEQNLNVSDTKENHIAKVGKMVKDCDILHVIPINDLKEHIESSDCWCGPEIRDNLIIHNALDGRE